MKQMKPASARALTWFAAITAVVGSMAMSPSGALITLSAAALLALFPALFGKGKARILAAVLLLVAAGLALAKYPDFRHEQALYRKHVDSSLRQQLPPK